MTEFLSYAGTVGIQVLILFLMISVGFTITKTKLLNADGAAQFTNLLLYIVTPCVIISSFESMEFSSKTINELLIAAGCAIFTHIIGFVIGFALFGRNDTKVRSPLICTCALSNCGFMGIPMAAALLGSQGVFLASVYIAVFNIFSWTVGYGLFTGGKLNLKKALINPGVIGTLIGLLIFFLKLNLPYPITSAVNYIAGVNSPLAMAVIGYYLASAPLKFEKGDEKMFLAMAMRLIAIPLICFGTFKLIGINGNLIFACIIPATAPCAAMVMMFSAKFDADTKLSSKGLSYSHLFSVVTMPLLLTLCQMFI